MEIISFTVGQLSTNCYLVTDHSSCIIIDPGDNADFISTIILEQKLTPKAILLTHAHFDHVLACLELKLNFNCPIYLNRADLSLYKKAAASAYHWTGEEVFRLPTPDKTLQDGQTLDLAGITVKVIATPGHTPGSTCFLIGSSLFTGDTIFAHGVGRTDFSYASGNQLTRSLNKLITLPPDTLIYPGHEDYGVPLTSALQNIAIPELE